MNLEDILVLIKNQEYDNALLELNLYLSKDPYNIDALFYKAKAQHKSGYSEIALETYNKLLNLIPSSADVYAERALVFLDNKEMDLSLEDFNKAVTLDENNAYRYSCRAYLKERIKDYNGALADYNKAIELDPEDAIAINNKGLLEEKMGHFEKAQKSFQKADNLQGIDTKLKDLASNLSLQKETKAEQQSPKPDGNTKLTFSSYIKILSSILFTNSGRKDFFNFLSKAFSTRK